MLRIILFLLLGAVATQASPSRLAALGMVESGDDDRAVGAVGEVSRYQIKPWIWRLYSQSEDYRNPVIATYVAGKHLAELESIFRKRAKRDPDDFDLYVLWNAGPTYYGRIAFSKGRVNPIVKERARRYANLREALELKLAKAQPTSPATARPTTVAASKAAALAQAPPAPAPRESKHPLFDVPQAPALQSPMFSILPLTAEPQPPVAEQKPIFAIGGLKPR